MSKRPWMPLYVAAYIKKTSHLRALESGAYLHLIMAYWDSGRLPNDDRQLATIAKVTDREWKQIKPTIAAFFGPDWSSHERIDEELARAEAIAEANSEKARDAANKRWAKHAPSMPQASAEHKPSNAPECTLHIEHKTKEESKEDSGAVAPKAGRTKRERKYATSLSDGFEPNYEAATRVGLSRREGEREFLKFKNHAAQTGRTCVSWQAAWSNWCINAAQYLKKPPPGVGPQSALTIMPASPSWNAWKSHFRDNNNNVVASLMDKCADEGRPFTVKSEWPPGHEMNNAA